MYRGNAVRRVARPNKLLGLERKIKGDQLQSLGSLHQHMLSVEGSSLWVKVVLARMRDASVGGRGRVRIRSHLNSLSRPRVSSTRSAGKKVTIYKLRSLSKVHTPGIAKNPALKT